MSNFKLIIPSIVSDYLIHFSIHSTIFSIIQLIGLVLKPEGAVAPISIRNH